MATWENVITGEKRTTTDMDKVLFYLSNPSIWQLVPLTDPGA